MLPNTCQLWEHKEKELHNTFPLLLKKISLIPKCSKKKWRRVTGIYCSHMHGSLGFLGNLETTVLLVGVARLYITELWELLHLHAA